MRHIFRSFNGNGIIMKQQFFIHQGSKHILCCVILQGEQDVVALVLKGTLMAERECATAKKNKNVSFRDRLSKLGLPLPIGTGIDHDAHPARDRYSACSLHTHWHTEQPHKSCKASKEKMRRVLVRCKMMGESWKRKFLDCVLNEIKRQILRGKSTSVIPELQTCVNGNVTRHSLCSPLWK